MKYVFTSSSMLERGNIETLKTLLENDGIPCWIKNENLSTPTGEISIQECFPEIWILNDEDYPKAYEMVKAWRNSPVETHDEWLCSDCGETIEGQFTACWKCGRQREEA